MDKKSEIIQIRVSKEIKEKIKKNAIEHNFTSLTDFIVFATTNIKSIEIINK